MSYNLIFVDVGFRGRLPTTVHRMNVITGDYLMPVYLKQNDVYSQIDELINIILEDRPDKIIFDKFGYGMGFYDYFIHKVNKNGKYRGLLRVDAFGLITYGDE